MVLNLFLPTIKGFANYKTNKLEVNSLKTSFKYILSGFKDV